MGSSPLLTDLYQLTMACAAHRAGVWERQAVFHLFFRQNPFGSGFTLACGLEQAIEHVTSLRFREDELDYLRSLQAADGTRLFDDGFLDRLRGLRLNLDIDAVPEGTIVFPQEPLLRVRGPVALGMLLETPLLNLIGYPTLVATKAARVCLAARGDPVIEFGLRRAPGPDGGLTASRAAFVGGCAGTSNLLAGKVFGIPVRGTLAHSWVMLFDDEPGAFQAFAEALPSSALLLVDTYDTLGGVRRAIEVGRALRARGHELLGIRLDSGDLAWLSAEARKLLDAAGFPKATIFASNDLDETLIASLKEQGAAIGAWGVGTRLVTGDGAGALGCVYKLSAVRAPGGAWQPRIKLSEQAAKISTPGILQVRRYRLRDEPIGDLLYDEELGCSSATLIDPLDPTRRKVIPAEASQEDLLVPVLREGKAVYAPPELEDARARALAQVNALHPAIRRFVNPHQYPVGLERRLHERRTELILNARGVRA